MSGLENVVIALIGLLLGGMNAFGLWWTLRRLPSSRNAATWLGISFVLRFLLTFGPLFVFAGHAPVSLSIGLIAILVGRRVAIRAIGVSFVEEA